MASAKIPSKNTTSALRATPPTSRASSTRPLIPRPKGSKFRTVLSIDGGGIRGIIPIMVLTELEADIKEHIFEHRDTLVPADVRSSIHSVEDFDIHLTDYFDLVAGTSIGSWIACYIAARGRGTEEFLNDPEIVQKYGHIRPGCIEAGRATFNELSPLVFPPRGIFNGITRWFRPVYPADGLEKALTTMFGGIKMSDVETGCLITSYDLKRGAACSFLRGPGPNAKNYTVRTAVRQGPRTAAPNSAAVGSGPGAQQEPAGDTEWDDDIDVIEGHDYYLRDIALGSSSLPLAFPPACISPIGEEKSEELVLVDGGVVAVNPTLQALTYIPSTFSSHDIRDVAVFSVGCGTVDRTEELNLNPGILWWLRSDYLRQAYTSGTGEYIQAAIDYWLYKNLRLPFGQYVRIQRSEPNTTEVGKVLSNMDDLENGKKLEEIGKEMAHNNASSIKQFVEDYIFKVKV